MSDDAEWDEFAKLGQERARPALDSKKRSEPVKPAENREKKREKRDSLDSWDFDAKPMTGTPKLQAEQPKYLAQNIKASGFGDFDDILEGKKTSGNKM